jgi:hypothetical protein
MISRYFTSLQIKIDHPVKQPTQTYTKIQLKDRDKRLSEISFWTTLFTSLATGVLCFSHDYDDTCHLCGKLGVDN